MTNNNWDIPQHICTTFFNRKNSYAICVFVLNEGEKFNKQILEMRQLNKTVDIIIADGGSNDNTIKIDQLKTNHVRALLVKTGEGRLSAQMRMAFAFCVKEGYEGVITIDGNNKDEPSQAIRFIEALENGYDHVQGSRFLPQGEAINTPPLRLLGIRLIHAPIISLASGYHYTDTTNGFRAYSRKFLLDPEVSPFRKVFSDYELHYYLAIRAPQLNYKITEVPVTRAYPATGQIPTKISPIKGNIKIIKTLVNAALHKYDPK